MSEANILEAHAVRHCTAKTLDNWTAYAAKDRLYAGEAEGDFRLICSNAWPGNETRFEAAVDGTSLHVSVMAPDTANLGRLIAGYGRNQDCLEVFLDPLCDGIGYLQFGATSDGTSFAHSHWPYRDPDLNGRRDPAWSVQVEEETQRPDVVRFFFFQFELARLAGPDCIGFQVGRSQHLLQENSTWNLVSGIGFCDPGCFGRLWLRPPVVRLNAAELEGNRVVLQGVQSRAKGAVINARLLSPSGEQLAEWKDQPPRQDMVLACAQPLTFDEAGRYRLLIQARANGDTLSIAPDEFCFDCPGTERRRLELQGTYDWPDNFGNVSYSPRMLAREMAWYRDCGIERLYWLDYPTETWLSKRGMRQAHWVENIERAHEWFGKEDFLWGAVRGAHAAGQTLVTIFKPFDLSPQEPFVREHPELSIRRNPAWTPEPQAGVCRLRINQLDDSPLPFRPASLQVWQSADNRKWERVAATFQVHEEIVDRPESLSTPLPGKPLVSDSVTRPARCVTIEGLEIGAPYLAVTVNECDPEAALPARLHMLSEVEDAEGNPLPCLCTTASNIPEEGFDFGPHIRNNASWSRADTGVDRLVRMQGPRLAIGITRNLPLFMPGFLDPTWPEVRAFWLERLRRGIDAGADGVSLRIAHHWGCVDWTAYMFAEPVLEAFREQCGRDPQPRPEDYTIIRKIRGEAYTQFLREASAMARKAERKLLHHVENRMLVPPELDCYCQIHWDWRTWIRERLVDEVDLKYIGPDHPDCYREILPLARRHGVKVNWITADPEPRTRPRSIEGAPQLVDRARMVGLDGINLYELWLYHRMTDRGTPLVRGCGEAVIREMRKRIAQ